jgi:ketosteroid isomerase-like protein
MKKSILLQLAIMLTLHLYAQLVPPKREDKSTANQQTAQQTVMQFFDALSNRDSVSLKNYSTTDISLYEYGQVWNMDTLILKAITQNQSSDFKRTNTFESITTSVDKNIVWATYRLQSTIFKDGKQTTVQWLETVVVVKERKKWKVKHLHSTLIKRT